MTTDELRAKFEEWYPNAIGDVQPFECYEKGYASRDAEVEALRKDAERYRFIRTCMPADFDRILPGLYEGDESLDRHIDAAMQEESK